MNKTKKEEKICAALKEASIQFTDSIYEIAKANEIDFLRCMIIEEALLTQLIKVLGRGEDLNKIIHLGDSKNE